MVLSHAADIARFKEQLGFIRAKWEEGIIDSKFFSVDDETKRRFEAIEVESLDVISRAVRLQDRIDGLVDSYAEVIDNGNVLFTLAEERLRYAEMKSEEFKE